MARYLPDGNIEFLGRLDHQVKIRGFRVEISEIESTLAQCPGIEQCVVLSREGIQAGNRLVAYFVPQNKQTITVNVLHRFLRSKLPDYMIPSAFVVLKALPLTPNGKVDRNALSSQDTMTNIREAKSDPPRTSMERVITSIWKDFLELDQIGIHENFFELGGHSLLAAQIISQFQKEFHIALPLHSMFDNPTVADLAKYIEELRTLKVHNANVKQDRVRGIL